MAELFGYIERVTFQNPETGYTVAQLKPSGKSALVCIVGFMPMLLPGETVRCQGEWKQHLVHGRQFEVSEYRAEAPADLIGIKKYLGSGLVKGIGPVYAKRITDLFGVETLSIIDLTPERLHEVPGIGKKRVDQIAECWAEQRSIRDVMIFLQTHGITPAIAQKIFKRYGAQSIAKIKENPFYLARDIFGIGFKTADTIAKKMGIGVDSPLRIQAGIEYVLTELAEDGHVCFPVDDFLKEACQVLELESPLIETEINTLCREERVKLHNLNYNQEQRQFIWNVFLFLSEVGIANEIKRLRKTPSNLRQIDAEKAVAWAQTQLSIELAANQKTAVIHAVTDKVHIITGGPGTGKSTITKAILTISQKLTSKILLAAPTGRAAKRMTEITGYPASTIHSLLQFDFTKGGFKRNREFPLDCDLLIVDESSMIDTQLMYHLLKAVPSHARLLFVGDINQLPSVGPGNVLKDMINSRQVSVTMLNEIFRQAAGSRIITNSHRINSGTFPQIDNHPEGDFFFMENETPEEVLACIISLVKERLPRKYGLDASKEIQVLAPMKKGVIGIENMNIALQESLNKNQQNALFRAGKKFLVGDKVMQIRNNYQKEVFNGDVGYIKTIDIVDQVVIVDFEGHIVEYEFNGLDELVLAYAVSIHKYQGSECPCVVIPVHTTHFMMLHRNLLYTGVTRGKKLVVLVGTKKALALAVKNDEVHNRYTGLEYALMGILNG